MAEAAAETICFDPLPDLSNDDSFVDINYPEHWFNYIWNIPENRMAYKVLNSGVPIMDFLRCPTPTVEPLEWLAFNLYNLIDRVSIFYDFVVLRCNDGSRVIDFTRRLYHGSEIILNDIEPHVKNLIQEPNPQCVGRVRIGYNESFPVDTELVHVYPIETFPEKYQDVEITSMGASTYIETTIQTLKAMRENNNIFPCNIDEHIQPTFINAARYILFHLITIVSHFTTCHFKDIADQKLNRQLFTLNSWLFSIGAHSDVKPHPSHTSTEFVLLCRHLRYIDSQVDRPSPPVIRAIAVEGAAELEPVNEPYPVSECSYEPDFGSHNSNTIEDTAPNEQTASNNITEDTAPDDEAARNNITEDTDDRMIVPKAMSQEAGPPIAHNIITRTTCNVSKWKQGRPRQKQRGKKRKIT